MSRSNAPLQTPTFAQTVVIIHTLPAGEQQDLEAIKRQHLALGFTYQNDQIHRALRATTRPSSRPSGRST